MSETTDRTCDGLGWCVKRDAAPLGEPWCNGAGRCVKGYAAVPPDDVHYSADGEPLAVQARRLVVENQRLTEQLRGVGALAKELSDRQVHAVVEGSHHDDGSLWRATWVGKATAFGFAAARLRDVIGEATP